MTAALCSKCGHNDSLHERGEAVDALLLFPVKYVACTLCNCMGRVEPKRTAKERMYRKGWSLVEGGVA